MTGRVHSVPIALVAIMLAAVAAAPAQASTEPTRSEAKAIKKAFLAGEDGKATIRKIRVSTVDPRFAAVFYEVDVGEPPAARGDTARTSHVPTEFAPPPVILKQGKGDKWKTVRKAPEKVKKDLKVKSRKSNIVISGEVSALLTQPATCTDDEGDFYSVGIYDPAIDLYLSIDIFQYARHGWYPARAVGSVAGLYSDSGTVLRFETGLAHDAYAPSGEILAKAGWGFIGAGMARTPPEEGTESNTVQVTGTWECR
ncbi:MAG TPA: hypothetical protein VFY99_08230 [Solirubrobacterales bacterium]